MNKNILLGVLLIGTLGLKIQNIQAGSKTDVHPVLSLEEAIVQALTQNPQLQSMQKDVDAAHAKVPQARSWDDPMVGVRFYQVPFSGSFDEAMDIDYIISQKIPFPGKKKAASQMAYHDYLHHIEQLGGKGREILRDIKTTYYSLYATDRMIESSRKIEGSLRTMIRGAEAKLAANQAMAVDALQGQAEIARVLAEREPLFQNRKTLQAKLNQLMALPKDAEIHLPSKLEVPRWEVSLEELIEIAQYRHPSVKMTEHQIDQKKWGVKAAKREYWPDLSVQLEYVQRPGPAENAWTGEFMLNIPLIVKKKMKAVEQSEAELASAQYSHIAAKNDAAYRVKEVYNRIKANEKILQLNRGMLIPRLRQALDAASVGYAAGKSDFIIITNILRSLFEAQMNYWKSFEGLATATYELEEAVGATQEEWAELKSIKIPESLSREKKE